MFKTNAASFCGPHLLTPEICFRPGPQRHSQRSGTQACSVQKRSLTTPPHPRHQLPAASRPSAPSAWNILPGHSAEVPAFLQGPGLAFLLGDVPFLGGFSLLWTRSSSSASVALWSLAAIHRGCLFLKWPTPGQGLPAMCQPPRAPSSTSRSPSAAAQASTTFPSAPRGQEQPHARSPTPGPRGETRAQLPASALRAVPSPLFPHILLDGRLTWP